jgi:hypothetical protein
MNRYSLFSKAALILLLISISTMAGAWGWGLSPDTDVLPVAGETRGDVNWMVYDVGEGPCAAYTPIPDPIPPTYPPTFANIQTLTTSIGILRPLGRVVIETAHCAEGPFALNGTMTLYAAGGTIEGIYEGETLFILPPPGPPYIPATGSLIVMESTFKLTGGSGHFENVSGRLIAQEFIEVGDYGYAADTTWSFRHTIAGYIQFPE